MRRRFSKSGARGQGHGPCGRLWAKREVTAELLEDLEPGDYVMVHAGMAIAKVMQSGEEEAGGLLADLLDSSAPAKERR